MDNTYFEHNSLHKYTSVEVRSMIDLMLVKKDMLRYVQEVRVKMG